MPDALASAGTAPVDAGQRPGRDRGPTRSPDAGAFQSREPNSWSKTERRAIMRLRAQSLTAKHATNWQVIPSQLSMCAFYVHTHTHMYTQTHITCTLHREEDSLLFFFFSCREGLRYAPFLKYARCFQPRRLSLQSSRAPQLTDFLPKGSFQCCAHCVYMRQVCARVFG